MVLEAGEAAAFTWFLVSWQVEERAHGKKKAREILGVAELAL